MDIHRQRGSDIPDELLKPLDNSSFTNRASFTKITVPVDDDGFAIGFQCSQVSMFTPPPPV